MSRIATLAAGLALLASQPVLAAPVQAIAATDEAGSSGDRASHVSWTRDPAKIAVVSTALAVFIWGAVNASRGNDHHGNRQPTSP